MQKITQTWKSWSKTTRFSIIAFIVTAVLGLFSMGILGALLYYPVCFLLGSFPGFDSWRGDWVWPAVICVGMFWSFGFIFSGLFYHFFSKKLPRFISYTIYIIILLLWDFILWHGTLSSQNWE